MNVCVRLVCVRYADTTTYEYNRFSKRENFWRYYRSRLVHCSRAEIQLSLRHHTVDTILVRTYIRLSSIHHHTTDERVSCTTHSVPFNNAYFQILDTYEGYTHNAASTVSICRLNSNYVLSISCRQ